ncbi:MAG TPA: hypothetical protein VN577_20535 [Terriglobales bacterium]|nr:hypothetical protein [Terriglobales bacterium]
MNKRLTALSCIMVFIAVFACAQEGFQTARVVSFEKLAASVQHPENSDRYKMSMRIGDILYMCEASGPVKTFMDWTINKELPAKVDEKAKVMTVQNFDGQMIELKIKGKKQPK